MASARPQGRPLSGLPFPGQRLARRPGSAQAPDGSATRGRPVETASGWSSIAQSRASSRSMNSGTRGTDSRRPVSGGPGRSCQH